MMKLKEIGASAAALASQVGASIPIDQATTRMVKLQPRYAEQWLEAASGIQSGQPLSLFLVKLWPASFVEAVKAGEEAGGLEYVFTRIEATVEIQMQLRSKFMQLAYPIGIGFGGFLVFVGFMIFVLPALTKALNTNSRSIFIQISDWMAYHAHHNWVVILATLAAAITLFASWARTQEAQKTMTSFALSIPIFGQALRDMYFGLWAHYMAMMLASGVTTSNALKSTSQMLPYQLKKSIDIFEADLSDRNKTLSESADLINKEPDDPRMIWWPFYISNAFIVAEQTGLIDKELLRVAPSLIKEGISTLNKAIVVLNFFALVSSATLITSPLVAYYVEIFYAIGNVGV